MWARAARLDRMTTSTRRVVAAAIVGMLLGPIQAARGSASTADPGPVCAGDCNDDGLVTIDELLLAVRIALDDIGLERCAAASQDGNPAVSIDELLHATRSVLDGCSTVPWTFRDVTAAAGVLYDHGYLTDTDHIETQVAGGVAAGDVDGDGDVDLYAVRGDIGPNLLFRNRGDGTFDEIGAAAGVAFTGTKGSGPVFADFDGDGHLDLFIGGIVGTAPRLLRNRGDGTFDDVTVTAGLAAADDTIGAAFADYDRDGDLDLFLTHWSYRSIETRLEHLWRNNGNATFTAVDLPAGLGDLRWDYFGLGRLLIDLTFTPNFADIDGDGWPDILLASDFGNSRIFLQRHGRDGRRLRQ
jgi:hypothetical protein